MKHSLSAIAAIALFATGALAQPAPGAEHIARDYMAAYSAVDWGAMEGFLAETAVFEDPTALGEDIGVDGLYHAGRDATLTALRAFADTYHPIELGFVWDTVFESNGRVVFMGEVNALYPTETEGQTFRWRASQVTVITVRDGQVIHHQDFANYTAPDQSLVLQ
jgi:hypothetical protein